MMNPKDIHEMIVQRLRRQLTEKEKDDKHLTPCSDEERWIRNSSWAVYFRKKSGPLDIEGNMPFSSRAAFRAPSKEEIIAYRKEKKVLKEDAIYKEFKGHATGCDFCLARYVCRQYQDSLREYEDQQQHELRELK